MQETPRFPESKEKKIKKPSNSPSIQAERRSTNWKVMALISILSIAGIKGIKSMNENTQPAKTRTQKEKQPHTSSHMDETTLDRSTKLLGESFKFLKEISEKSRGQKIRDVIRFINDNGEIAVPIEDGFAGTNDKKSAKAFFTMIITKEDAEKFPYWKHYSPERKKTAGHFLPDRKLIILKEGYKISRNWQAILFAHEGFHAYSFELKPYDWKNPKTHAEQEVEAHDFENNLLLEIGGEKYMKILTKEIERISKAVEMKKPEDSDISKEYPAELDDAFGPVESDFEKDLRKGHLYIHACFKMIERDLPEPSIVKRNLLAAMYKEGGLNIGN